MNNFLNIKTEKKFLISLFLLAFFIRALFFIFFLSKNTNYSTYDTHQYHDVAVQIFNGKGISNLDGKPHFYRLPGYSTYLALCYKLFNKVDIKLALFIQVMLSSFIPILIFFLSLILFPLNLLLAKIVSIISAIHLGLVIFSGYAMTESFFIIFFLLFSIFFLKSIDLFWCKSIFKKQPLLNFFLAGVFLGLAFMFRPVGHYLLIVSLFLILISNMDFIYKLKSGSYFFIGWFLIMFSLLIRNFLLTGFIFFHTLSGIHFLKHSAARINSEINNCSYQQGLENVSQELNDMGGNRKLSEIEKCLIAEKISFKYFTKDLFITLKHCSLNIFKTCFGLYSSEILYIDSGGKLPDYDNSRSFISMFKRFLFPKVNNKFLIPLIYLEMILFLFIWLGFIFFVIKSFFCMTDFCVLVKIIPFIGIFLIITLSCGFARLRLPIEPFLIILSFKFWIEFLRRGKKYLWEKV